ncbi:MAG TPA: hypothetical protein VFA93_00195 [Patescibacteria group bacterium]|nr:hypothetical protein [Patescibacteria group bacterium]
MKGFKPGKFLKEAKDRVKNFNKDKLFLPLKNLYLISFVVPLVLFYFYRIYGDSFYAIIAVISLIFFLSLLFPKTENRIIFIRKFNLNDIKESFKLKQRKESLASIKLSKSSFKNSKPILLIIFFIFLIYFTILGRFFLVTIPGAKNPIIEYYISQIELTKSFFFIDIVIFLIVFFLFSQIARRNFRFKPANRLKLMLLLFVFGMIFSLVSLFLYGVVEVNLYSITARSPVALGIIHDNKAIIQKLKTLKSAPKVIGVESNSKNLLAIIFSQADDKKFYSLRIQQNIPRFLTIPIDLPNYPLFFVKNTLVINQLDKDQINAISPVIARLFLEDYFKNRELKEDPKIIILNRQEYLAFREDRINDQVNKIKDIIQKIEDYINSLYSDINTAKQKIAYNQQGIQSAQQNKDYYYNSCVNAGYWDYWTGSFYRYYSQSYCDSIKSQYDDSIAQFQKNINDWNDRIGYDQGELSSAQSLDQNYKDWADAVDAEKNTTPEELGIFEDPNTIRVVLDSTSPSSVNEFLETLVHENLHYQSFVSKDRFFQFSDKSYDGFWEEGLTEYFARKVIAKETGSNVNQGYPLIVKIIGQVVKKIPESELQRIYFTKDEASLEADLNSAYGENFYKDTELFFESLSYLPSDRQLKIANNIMTRIRGEQLSSKDLFSTDVPGE